ncbi:hypothetical protein D3C72_1343890 [compost metagenome]
MNGQKLQFMPAEPSSAPEKRRMRNTAKSIIGSAWRRSIMTNSIRLISATARLATLRGSLNPSASPCVRHQARLNTPSDRVAMPATSSLRRCGSRDSLTPSVTSSNAASAKGPCTRNTHCQFDSATMAAPMMGPKPRPRPRPNTMPQAPNARPRAAPSGNCCDSTATWQISMAPPAMPCSARAAISTPVLAAQPHASELRPNRIRLASSKRLRP